MSVDIVHGTEYCNGCGEDITTGYSWRGLCVVCAEPAQEAERQRVDQLRDLAILNEHIERLS